MRIIKLPAVIRLKEIPLIAGATMSLTFLLRFLIFNFFVSKNNKTDKIPRKMTL